jgi:hypothetical protein
MPKKPRVVAKGKQSVAIGGDLIGSLIITGNRNQVFLGAYEPLGDAYIHPKPVFDRVQVDDFVGRAWLTDDIDRFVAAEGSGYVIIEAPAGLGKTAYLAHLVHERHYVHHFCELARGAAGIEPTLKSLAAQVLLAEQLVAHADDALLPARAAERPDFLVSRLEKAAQRRREEGRGPFVVVVDGLDEAGTPDGQNVLGLPERVPDGVVFIVAMRPVDVALRVEGPRHVIPLTAQADENLRDVRAYLERRAAEPPLAQALSADAQEMVDKLVTSSRGVWVYLHYVLADLEAEVAAAARKNRPAALELDDLPDGLWRYYARTWLRWRDRPDEFYDIDLPLLATLAAAQEPTSAELLRELAGIAPFPRLRRLFTGRWRPFLAQEGAEPRYSPYHASVREFLEGGGDVEAPTPEERDLAAELADAWRMAHARIADRYLTAWGPGLGGLADPASRALDGGYGLRNIAAHLELSGRGEEVHRLLACEAEGRNAWFAARAAVGDVRGYELDVDRAWRIAAEQPPAVALEVRYALLRGSVRAPAGSVPAEVMGGLVAGGVWTRSQALDYAAWIDHPDLRLRWLTELVSHLDGEERHATQEEALQLARALGEDTQKALRLAELAVCSEGSVRDEVIELAVAEAEHELASNRASVLAACAALVAEPRRSELLASALDSIEELDGFQRWLHLIKIGPNLPDALRDRGRHLSQDIENTDQRAEALIALAPLGADPVAAVEAGFGAVQSATEGALRLFARAAARAGDAEIASAVFTARDRLTDAEQRAEALIDVFPLLAPPDQPAARATLIDTVGHLDGPKIVDVLADEERVARFADRVPTIYGELLDALLHRAEAFDGYWAGRALVAVAAHLAAPRRRAALESALQAVTRIGDEGDRARALAAISSQLAEPECSRVWRVALAQTTLSDEGRYALPNVVAHTPPACADDAERAIAEGARHHGDDECWSALAVRLAQLGMLERAFATVGKTTSNLWLARALEKFPAELPEAAVRTFLTGLGTVNAAWAGVLAAGVNRWLPEPEATAYATGALDILNGLDAAFDRGLLLRALVPHAPEGVIDRIVEVILGLKMPSELERDQLLAAAAGRLAQLGRRTDALALGKSIHYRGGYVTLIAAVIAHSPRQIGERLLDPLDRLLDMSDWWGELIELANAVADEPARTRIIDAMIARAADDPPHDRARVLAAALPLVAPERRPGLAREAWELPSQSGVFWGTETLAELAPHLAELPAADAYQCWHSYLARPGMTRAHTLAEVAALAPLLAAIGGPEQLAGVATAIEDIQRWWP